MKILFAIQGTGNGHLSRAIEVIPHLKKWGVLHLLVSGTDSQINLPHPIRYKLPGIGFVFGNKGGFNWTQTIANLKLFRFMRDVESFPIHNYDVVINDFEPITAWAAKLKGIKTISFSHQASFWTENAPRPPQRNLFAERILKSYAPTTDYVGLHFQPYHHKIQTPIIRSEIRKQIIKNLPHVTVYLPAYSDAFLANIFKNIPDVQWHIFSKRCKKNIKPYANVVVLPIDGALFTQSMAQGLAVICGAGFETPAEALFLRKNLLVVPMKGQYEQACNATALQQIGVTALNTLHAGSFIQIKEWLYQNKNISVSYPDHTAKTVETLIKMGIH